MEKVLALLRFLLFFFFVFFFRSCCCGFWILKAISYFKKMQLSSSSLAVLLILLSGYLFRTGFSEKDGASVVFELSRSGSMDKEKSPVPGGGGGGNAGGLPPQSSRYALFASPSDSCGITNDPSSSSSQPLDSGQFGHVTPSDAARFSYDVSRMPDCPPKNSGHRRAHSEILSLPDDLSFGSDLGVVGSHDGPSFSDETEEDLVSMFIDIEKFSSSATSAGLSIPEASPVPALPQGDNVSSGSSEKPRMRHQHSQSLDGTAIKPELLMSGGEGPSSLDVKKAMSATKLAELALVDPKRAKRFHITNNHFFPHLLH